jgi:2-dehydro-3-deoxygluconokinase
MKRIVCLGEILLRLGAPGHEPLLRSPRLETSIGGAEANVAIALAGLGLDSALVSTLPANPLGDACLGELRRHGVDTSGIGRAPGRLGLYFLTQGAMLRASAVVYDRAGSAFAEAEPTVYDWAGLLDGAAWLHVTGITLALGPRCEQAVAAAVQTAVANGVQVSFDCNFRPSLWAGREPEARRLLAATALQADLVFANSADAELMFGLDTKGQPGAGRLHALAAGLSTECPRLRWLAGTNRVVHGAGHHELSGFLVDRGSFAESGTLALDGIVDRIGAGDAYAAGVLYGLSQAMAPQQCVTFATTLAALKHSVPGDFLGLRADEVRDAMGVRASDVRR